MKEKSDIKPVIVKVGLALALSIASFVYSRFRPKRPFNSFFPSSDSENISDSRGKDDKKIPSVASETHHDNEDSFVKQSSKSEFSKAKEVFLFPEFNSLVKEFDTCNSEDVRRAQKQFVEGEKEISDLQDTVRELREREMNLEAQLLEFYGIKEQESEVIELRNRLKLNAMEVKLFSLKIESLRAENQKLKAQVADKAHTEAELDATRAKIRHLKDKLRVETEKNKEHILSLKQRVSKLEDDEYTSLTHDSNVQRTKLKRLSELETEIEELKKSNSILFNEKSDLTRKLESASIPEHPKADGLKEVSDRVRKENEDLKNEIEQLQADRCLEIEELVYLRWINACLRYELRDYRPGNGKTIVARDLSKTLSPKSEEKAKQLIMEYAASSEGQREHEILSSRFLDFDSDRWSSSLASLTDSAERDRSSMDSSSGAKTHNSGGKKFFSKLLKLVRGKEDHESTMYTENDKMVMDSSEALSRLSLDTKTRQRNSDVGPSCVYKTLVLGDSTPKDQVIKSSSCNERAELSKYADALKRSRRESLNLHRKTASYDL